MTIQYKILVLPVFLLALNACRQDAGNVNIRSEQEEREGREQEEYDEPGMAMKFEFDKTKDPVTGDVPRELLWPIIEYTDQLKRDIRLNGYFNAKTTLSGWTERGPNSDAVGPDNGNPRANSGVASGRIRAVLIDASDNTGNTVFAAGVAGGLWKTTNIASNPAGWTLVNDKLSNLAITGICQDLSNPSTMYFCTGEANYNSDAVRGDGIFKSTDGGSTWARLAATAAGTTSQFNYCSKIVCDATGNVYVGTRSGLKRSTDGGTSWTDITPSSTTTVISDVEISSTGRMHVTCGIHPSLTTVYYRYTDNPSTVSASSGWNAATTSFPTSNICHVVLACQGNKLLALPAGSGASSNVAAVYRSTDGGDHWSALASTPTFTSGQGWYCLAAAINPSNTNQFMVGSLDCYRSQDSGANWSQISEWYNQTGKSYVHADQQEMIWYNASSQSRVLVVSDGGIFLSTDSGSTFSDRNTGLRIKQFYACALHPNSGSNYLLGGAQDNGSHTFSNSGLSNSVEVTGGDGGFVHIDQNQPQYQFTSYVYNNYFRSTNSGANWTNPIGYNTGLFINPTDYDNAANILYCSEGTNGYRRWTDPQTGATSDVVAVTALNSGSVYAVTASPYIFNRLYLGTGTGTNGGRLVKVDNANTSTSPAAGSLVYNFGSNLTISSIVFGGSEDTVVVTVSNYGTTQVYYSTNATAASPTFSAKDGNLPDMPVRWSLIVPGTGGKRVMLATETGVWVTSDISATSPTWVADANFPNVRTDMLRYRSSDRVVAAATHGRGMWTAVAADAVAIALPYNAFVLKGAESAQNVTLIWTFKTVRQYIMFDVERSEDGSNFMSVARQQGGAGKENYQYAEPRSTGWRYYRIKAVDQYGLTQYSNIVSMAPANVGALQLSNVFPNPAKDQVNITVNSPGDENIRMVLYVVSGQKLRDVVQQIGRGTQNISLGLAGVNVGNYLLTITIKGQRYSYVVIKQ